MKKHQYNRFWLSGIHAYSPRVKVLKGLWQELRQFEELPQLDRWMAAALKKDRRLGARDRQWYYEAMFRIIRYGIWILVAQTLLDNDTRKLFLADASKFISENEFDKQPNQWWELLRNCELEEFFLWMFLRDECESTDENWQSVWENSLFIDVDENMRISYLEVINLWRDLIVSKETDLVLMARALWNGIPPYFFSLLSERMHKSSWSFEQLVHFLDSQNIRVPLWIRLNEMASLDSVRKDLESIQITIQGRGDFAYEIVDNEASLKARRKIKDLPSFRSGQLEIQDLASQMIGEKIPVQDVLYVWDACAGGGGKTLQIASRLKKNKRATVYASDVRAYKLEELKRRARKSRLNNVRCIPWQGYELDPIPTEVKQNGGFDSILIDAPCSSSGTWRRNPDARYRTSDRSLMSLTSIQAQLCESVYPVLKSQGYLIYATCSWLTQENEKIVETWLRQNPGLRLINMQTIGLPIENADTMFVALLQKTN